MSLSQYFSVSWPADLKDHSRRSVVSAPWQHSVAISQKWYSLTLSCCMWHWCSFSLIYHVINFHLKSQTVYKGPTLKNQFVILEIRKLVLRVAYILCVCLGCTQQSVVERRGMAVQSFVCGGAGHVPVRQTMLLASIYITRSRKLWKKSSSLAEWKVTLLTFALFFLHFTKYSILRNRAEVWVMM